MHAARRVFLRGPRLTGFLSCVTPLRHLPWPQRWRQGHDTWADEAFPLQAPLPQTPSLLAPAAVEGHLRRWGPETNYEYRHLLPPCPRFAASAGGGIRNNFCAERNWAGIRTPCRPSPPPAASSQWWPQRPRWFPVGLVQHSPPREAGSVPVGPPSA